LPALEANAKRDRALARPIGAGIAAFIAARGDRGLEPLVSRLGDLTGTADPLAQLRLLAQMQARYHAKPLPALGAWVAERLETLLGRWHSRPRRAELRPQLLELATSGQLSALLALLDDPQAHRSDDHEVKGAARDLARIDAALALLASGGPLRAEQARRLGQEIAAGLGLSALALMLVIAALG
jgi:eukaryotic-like serine/threonine-protein kinase